MFKVNKIEVSYPYGLYNSLKKLPVNNVFPCSTLFNDKLIGGLLFTCSTNDLSFFNIESSNLPQPNLKFRMLNIEQKSFLIEFHLLFDNNKTLKLYLDPIHLNVKLLFKILIEKRFIAFHFYNKQTNLIISSYTNLDEEEMEWLIRNEKLINNLENNIDYLQIISYMIEQVSNDDRLYQFNGSKSIKESFIMDKEKVIKWKNHQAYSSFPEDIF